ncbi:hypothetical protein Tco_1265176 [Tanacetum coccineum]
MRGSSGSSSTLTIPEHEYAIALGTDSTHATSCSPARHQLQVLDVVGEGSIFLTCLVRDEVYFAFGRHLEEIHMTWAHLEKKRTRLRTYTNIAQEFLLRRWRRRHRLHVTPSQRFPRRRHKISRRLEGDLRKFSDIGAWVHVPRCMAWLDYDEHVDSLSIDDPKRHYGFKLGLLRKSVSLDVDISNWEMFDDDWGLESKEVSPLGEELSLFDRPNEVGRENLALYDNKSWNDPRDFAKPVKAIALPQDVPSTSDHRLIEIETQVQRLMEAHLALTQPTQVNKIITSCEVCSGPHDTHNCMKVPEQTCVDYASSRTNKMGGKRLTLNEIYQIKLEKALLDFDSHQEKRLSHLKTQLGQQQDDMIEKINLLWKTVSKKLNDTSSPENAKNFMAPKNIIVISYDEREELKKNGIKSPSKLLSPKYLSPASIKELNKNPSSPKRVHFVNSIVILSTDSDTKEEDVSSTNACDLNLGGMVKGKEGVKEQGEEDNEMETDMEIGEVIEEKESEFETDEEVEEIIEEEEDDEDGENFNLFPTMKELTHHAWILKNPRPPWVKARIRAGSTRTTSISFFPFGMDRSPSSRDILT